MEKKSVREWINCPNCGEVVAPKQDSIKRLSVEELWDIFANIKGCKGGLVDCNRNSCSRYFVCKDLIEAIASRFAMPELDEENVEEVLGLIDANSYACSGDVADTEELAKAICTAYTKGELFK